jgi:hypothetical protein
MMETAPVSETSTTPATSTADPAQENAALRGALEKVRSDFAALQGESQLLARTANESKAALGAALRERDTFKADLDKLTPIAKEAEGLRVQVQGYVNAGREAAIVDALRAKLTGAEPLAIRGVLSTLHEQGKVNKFAEDATAEAGKALELISKEAPSLARPLTTAGGSSAVRQSPSAPVRKSLVG